MARPQEEEKPRLCTVKALPPMCRFRPSGWEIVVHFLPHKGLHGVFPGKDGIIDGLDPFSVHPQDLPFPPCNQTSNGIWFYFFAVTPIGEYRHTPEGYWYNYGDRKEYVDSKGQVIAFRIKYAFYENDGNRTIWRMKEYRLNKNTHRSDGGPPSNLNVNDYVVCKIYTQMEFAELPHVEFVY